MKNILLLNWMDIKNPKSGGQEKYCYEIGKRLGRDGYKVTWISSTFKGSKPEEVVDGILIRRVGNIFTVFARTFFTLLNSNDDTLFFLSVNSIPFIIRQKFGKKLVMLHHRIGLKTMFRKIGPMAILSYTLQNFFNPWLFRNDKIITNSKSSKSDFEHLKYKDIDIVKLGVDAPELNIGGKLDIVVSPGPVKPWKHHDWAIEAFSHLDQKWSMLIFGNYESEHYRVYLENLCRGLNVSDRVKLLGRIDDEEVKKIFKLAKICLLATEKEGWGFAAMEAQANGCPVVAFNVPGLRDSVKDGESGLLVNYGNVSALGNALVKLASDKVLFEKFSKGAVDWSRQYDWESCYCDFVAQLQSIE